MRLAVLSDIHGNIVALDSVIADLQQAGPPDVIWVLGDLAAFGSSPSAAIIQVQSLTNVEIIQGNTDRYLTAGVRPSLPPPTDEEDWPKMAGRLARRDSIFQWIYERLSYDDFVYLKRLPTELTLTVDKYGQLTAFHAAPHDDEFGFAPETKDDIIRNKLVGTPAGLVMMGHTHRPMDRQIGDWRVLNVGSVGLPFDGDPRAAYAILDFDSDGNLSMDLRRVTYDIEKEVGLLTTRENPGVKLQAARLRAGLLNPSNPATLMLRYLVLFDIDGTLVWSDGAGKAAMGAALQQVYGTQGNLDSLRLHGQTDRQIVYSVLKPEGFPTTAIDARFDQFCNLMTAELAARLPQHNLRPCDGGLALVKELGKRHDVMIGLVTGNFEQTAFLKLEAAGYRASDFRVGAYGSEHANRADLPPQAVERARAISGHRFVGNKIVIVGDTPDDISCGQSVAARSVAVATGMYSVEQLRAYNPDGLLPDLSDTHQAMAVILDMPNSDERKTRQP